MTEPQQEPQDGAEGSAPNRQQRVWQVVASIPRGRVASYGQIAELAGLPGHARYVGYTLRTLPADSKLPWHRVINAQGRLSFPPASAQYQRQKALLEEEGLVFLNGRLALSKHRWQP
jgi:methylated-DNA-protein-cysteine methyltransferase-like protein